MRIIPPELRGRVFAILRTLMQSTAPVGGILAGALSAGVGINAAIVAAALVTTLPGLLGLVLPALAEHHPGRDQVAQA